MAWHRFTTAMVIIMATLIIMAMIGQNRLIVKTITSSDFHSQPSTLFFRLWGLSPLRQRTLAILIHDS